MPCRGKCVWPTCVCNMYHPNNGLDNNITKKCRCGHGEVWHEIITEEQRSELETEYVLKVSQVTPTVKPKPSITIPNYQQEPPDPPPISITPTNNMCVACEDQIKNIVIFPCRHVSMCRECFNKWYPANTTCPMCRGTITSFTEI